MTTFATFANY